MLDTSQCRRHCRPRRIVLRRHAAPGLEEVLPVFPRGLLLDLGGLRILAFEGKAFLSNISRRVASVAAPWRGVSAFAYP